MYRTYHVLRPYVTRTVPYPARECFRYVVRTSNTVRKPVFEHVPYTVRTVRSPTFTAHTGNSDLLLLPNARNFINRVDRIQPIHFKRANMRSIGLNFTLLEIAFRSPYKSQTNCQGMRRLLMSYTSGVRAYTLKLDYRLQIQL